MTPKEKTWNQFELALFAITSETEIDREALLARGRDKSVCAARHVVWYALHTAFEWHPKKIASYFNRDRTTVIIALQRMKRIVQTYKKEVRQNGTANTATAREANISF